MGIRVNIARMWLIGSVCAIKRSCRSRFWAFQSVLGALLLVIGTIGASHIFHPGPENRCLRPESP